MMEVRRLAEQGRFDYLLIESTGISEPLPVAATFTWRDDEGKSLDDVARLDTMVTVVDTASLLRDFSSVDFLRERGESNGPGDERTLIDLLVEQIEFADVVVLNKTDLATPEQLVDARTMIRALNADARIVESSFGRVPLDDVLDTGLFDAERAAEHPLWVQELNGFADHVPETEEYGIRSFVYRARPPFNPLRFHQFLQEDWPGIVRAKGFFWLATRPDWAGELSLAGAQMRNEASGFWWASVPQERWPQFPEFRQRLRERWDPRYGDRQQEIVFIGSAQDMDEAAMRARLDACLVGPGTSEPLDAEGWPLLPDPFPEWRR
ncbi:MAG: GTP-binding protein [Thermomicrobiales bacterium]